MANRRRQIEAIQKKAEALADELEILRDEMQEAYDNLPDSFKDGVNGQLMYDRIDTLTEWLDNLQTMGEPIE